MNFPQILLTVLLTLSAIWEFYILEYSLLYNIIMNILKYRSPKYIYIFFAGVGCPKDIILLIDVSGSLNLFVKFIR